MKTLNIIRSTLVIAALHLVAYSIIFGQGSGGSETRQNRDTSGSVDQNSRSMARVNPTTLAMEINVPMSRYPGRNGNSLSIGLSYSSKLWELEDFLNWNYQQPFSCNIKHVSDLRPKYSKRAVSGWTSSISPPVIEEHYDVFDEDGQRFSSEFNITQVNNIYGQLAQWTSQQSQNIISDPDIPCGWYVAGWRLDSCVDNVCYWHSIMDYNACELNNIPGGIEPGQGCQNPGEPPTINVYYIKRVNVRTSDGAIHEFRADDTPILCGTSDTTCNVNSNGTYLSTDGSGMRLVRSSEGSILFTPDGSRFEFPATQQHVGLNNLRYFVANRHTDVDGNITTYSETATGTNYSAKQTDTLGRELTSPLPQNFGRIGQSSGGQNVDLPGLNGAQHYEMNWLPLKPYGCESSTDPTCGNGNGALENQIEKLSYFSNRSCNGNLQTDLSADGSSYLFSGSGFAGLRVCNPMGSPLDENGVVIEGAPSVPIRVNPVVLAGIKLPNGKTYS